MKIKSIWKTFSKDGTYSCNENFLLLICTFDLMIIYVHTHMTRV